MPEEDGQIQIEQQSNAGKWMLILFAVVLIAVFGYALHHAFPRREIDQGS